MESASRWSLRESLPDANEYLALFETTGWNCEYHLTAEELNDALRRGWYWVGAYDRDRLVATGRIVSDGTFHALIVDVIVRPEYQAQGLGTNIMQRLLEHCRQARIRDVQLFCAQGKASFYGKLGFVSRPVDAPGMDYRPA